MNSPFGDRITAESIIESLDFFDNWEERYSYIIDVGKELPTMSDALKTEDRLVKGCQSLVWIDTHEQDGRLHFNADSDAHIVRGLLAVVLAAVNQQKPEDIITFDMEKYFADIALIQHLSPTRGNGLKSMVEYIRALAVKATRYN